MTFMTFHYFSWLFITLVTFCDFSWCFMTFHDILCNFTYEIHLIRLDSRAHILDLCIQEFLVKSFVLLILVWRIFRQTTTIENTVCVWKSSVKCDHAQKISSNQLLSNFFSESVHLTKKMLIFQQNSWSRFIVFFHTIKKNMYVQCLTSSQTNFTK